METMKTYSAKPGEVTQQWFVVDAEGQTLGRLATRIATVLRGKHKPQFTPHVDVGDFVIVLNASKVDLTGRKLEQKHYPGGLRSLSAGHVREHDSERMITQAVKGMLPKNRLSRQIIKKLKVYAGPEHPHEAQQPVAFPDHV
jgi:large subunit ribosomal protein L13